MAQLERLHRHAESPKTPFNHTIEQLIRGGEASRWSPTTANTPSPSSSSFSSHFFGNHHHHHHDPEEDHIQPPKKSMLAKVKEKAKKLRHSLSGKRRQGDEDGNITPSWGVSLEDEDEEDSEYLGAPMYELELAPEGYKEATSLHQRSPPLFYEKHVSSSSVKPQNIQSPRKIITQEPIGRPPSPNKTPPTRYAFSDPFSPHKTTSPNKTSSYARAFLFEPLSPRTCTQAANFEPLSLNKTTSPTHLYRTRTTTLAANDDPYSPYKRTSSRASNPEPPSPDFKTTTKTIHVDPPSPNKTIVESVNVQPSSPIMSSTEKPAPAHANVSNATHAIASKFQGLGVSSPSSGRQSSSSSLANSDSQSGKQASPTGQIWDKGVSVKEYLMNKFEPGEDEKALSEVISEAMSPRRTPGDAGVVEKVREAVTSLLRNEGTSRFTTRTTSVSHANSPIPAPTNVHEVGEEENHGRILQAN